MQSINYTANKANGPSVVALAAFPSNPIVTGSLSVYDSDNSTVLLAIPKITMSNYDRWTYVP